MLEQELAVVILAAGKGKRMKSDSPKVLELLDGKPLIKWVVGTAKELEPERIAVIVGFGGSKIEKELGEENIIFVIQEQQLGTAHAMMQVHAPLEDFEGKVLVLSGDVPLIKAGTLQGLLDFTRDKEYGISFLTTERENPSGYGRVVRSPEGEVMAVVEEGDATPEQKKIKEINGGVYLFDSRLLFELLPLVNADNNQKEYYLTDIIKIALSRGVNVAAVRVADSNELLGVNRPEDMKTIKELFEQEGERRCQV